MKLISWFVTWDSGILTALGLLLAYTVLIRRHKALATLVSVYIGYLIATIWGNRVLQFFTGNRVFLNQIWIRANTSPYTVQTLLMIVIILLLSSFMKLGGRRSQFSLIEVVFYAISSIALILMFMLSFMPPAMHEQALHLSFILPYIDHWKEWILVVPVFAIIFFGIYGSED